MGLVLVNEKCKYNLLKTCFLGFAGNQLFVYLQNIQSYLAPSISSMFLLGILWTGLTEHGAVAGLLVGFAMGIIKFIVENAYAPPDCGEEDTRPGFAKLHFMYYCKQLLNSLKGATLRMAHLEKNFQFFQVHLSQSVLIFSILNHPCSCLVYYYLFGVFLP